jgi:hypothetical protein
VTFQDGDVNSHVIEFELHAAANSAELLNDIIVTKHVTAVGEQRSVLSLTVVSMLSTKFRNDRWAAPMVIRFSVIVKRRHP